MQCGFCTPGMVMSCAALLARNRHPSLDDVKTAVSGNLCRCGTYPKVFAATLAASGAKPPPGTQVVAHAAVLHDEAWKKNQAARPEGEPPPWPASDQLAIVGKSQPRVDGKLKVTGQARYTADVRLPGMLFARRVVSPHPHARVLAIDVSAAERLPGVKAVHVVERNEGARLRNPPQVADKYPIVRYAGQAVAAVAATSQAIADEAARLVKVNYEPLPFVVDARRTRARATPPLVYPGPVDMGGSAGGGGAARGLPQNGNVRGPSRRDRGDVDAAMKTADLVVEGEFATQVQTHSALETHGVVADWHPDGLTVYASTQGTATVRDELATVFDLPKAKVRVITEFMGGGFGAKFGAGSYGVLATHLSKQAGAPVRLMLDRKEEHLCVGNRPATVQTLKLGARKDGTLTAISLVSHGNGGIATGGGVGWMGTSLYACDNTRSEQYDVFTNGGPAAAFRAPGQPQGAFAVEQLIDELAEKLALDPIALRDKLDAGPGAPGPGGNDAATRAARKAERHLGAERFGWHQRRKPGSRRRRPSSAASAWRSRCGGASSISTRRARCGCTRTARSSSSRRCRTSAPARARRIAMVVAEELGIGPQDVTMKIGDTQFPIGPSSGGSKTLLGITAPARVAAWRVKQQLYKAVGEHGAPPAAAPGRGQAADGESVGAGHAHARLRRRPARRLRRRAVRGGRRRHRDRRHQGRAHGGGARLRAGGQPAGGAERRSTAASCTASRSRSTRTGTSIARPAAWSTPTSISTRSPGPKRRPRSRWCWSTSTSGAAPPTPTASASRPTSPRRRRSPTPSTTRSACACGRCR